MGKEKFRTKYGGTEQMDHRQLYTFSFIFPVTLNKSQCDMMDLHLRAHQLILSAPRDVPDEVYQSLDAVGDGEKWWEVVNIPL